MSASHVSVEVSGDGTGGSARWISGMLSESGRAGIVVYGDPTEPDATIGAGGAAYGRPKVEMGELSDGDHGLAVVNSDGQLTKLEDFIFGPREDTVEALESTTSLTFVDLTTPGPSVTVNVGDTGRVMVGVSCLIRCDTTTADGGGAANVELSGANVRAASDLASDPTPGVLMYLQIPGAPNIFMQGMYTRTRFMEGLNPGPTTFTLKYRTFIAQAAKFQNRVLWVLPY